ncbi:MAG: PhoH family protein [Leptolyngbya sp. PLA3]|nr:MAG: PhoH family protein [Cyanobacteria bacterium CYA]MCE7967335.1 PhoH family protein [Leptolyngbya sp. PL-A3]
MVGVSERNLKMLREMLGVHVTARERSIRLEGEARPVSLARVVLEQLRVASDERRRLTREQVLAMITEVAQRGPEASARTSGSPAPPSWEGDLDVYVGGARVQPKTENQEHYLDLIRRKDLVIGVGPAGTGKTYLAVAAAVHMLKKGLVQRLLLVRPAVEAGERLGFLPGDMQAKVNPYLRPLLDALHDMMDFPTIRRFMDNDVIEIVPLAFMRGRTLNNAVIILDEAQNTTRGQMKMFLTRMGHGSKMIVTGDSTQIDLPDPAQSGLIDAARRLRRVPGVGFAALSGEDVVRHRLVQRIVAAYGDEDRDSEHAAAMREAFEGVGPDGDEG